LAVHVRDQRDQRVLRHAQTHAVAHAAQARQRRAVFPPWRLVRSAAISYARYRIRVDAVAPALTRTELSKALWQNDALLAASVAMHPLGRIGEPGDMAAAVMYLLSDESAWTTGQILGVDGGLGTGMTAQRPPPAR
jgi:NAD(P)-dependent dehydrogenase (short-subunit alcohol dehydrogenase family)